MREQGRHNSAGPSDSGLSHPVAPPSEGICTRAKTVIYRSERNPARSSEAYSSGCSQAAKWPPRSTSL